MSTVSFLYQGDMQGVAHSAGDNDRRNVYPINIGTDAVTNTGRTEHCYRLWIHPGYILYTCI